MFWFCLPSHFRSHRLLSFHKIHARFQTISVCICYIYIYRYIYIPVITHTHIYIYILYTYTILHIPVIGGWRPRNDHPFLVGYINTRIPFISQAMPVPAVPEPRPATVILAAAPAVPAVHLGWQMVSQFHSDGRCVISGVDPGKHSTRDCAVPTSLAQSKFVVQHWQ